MCLEFQLCIAKSSVSWRALPCKRGLLGLLLALVSLNFFPLTQNVLQGQGKESLCCYDWFSPRAMDLWQSHHVISLRIYFRMIFKNSTDASVGQKVQLSTCILKRLWLEHPMKRVFQAQQRGVEATKAILRGLIDGVELPDSKIYVLDLTTNRLLACMATTATDVISSHSTCDIEFIGKRFCGWLWQVQWMGKGLLGVAVPVPSNSWWSWLALLITLIRGGCRNCSSVRSQERHLWAHHVSENLRHFIIEL